MSQLDRHRPPPALRLATRIHDQITRRHQNDANRLLYPLERLSGRLEQVALLHRRMALAQKKGWQHAQAQLLTQLQVLLRSLPGEVRLAEQAIPAPIHILPIAELAREFQQIEDEFGAWDYSRPGTLIATTDPITLEEIALGAFEIRLSLDKLNLQRSDSPYELVALSPNPASSNESVTHPHVRDGELCEGDAAVPIKAALAEGRLCDFFMLVRSVLQTYNPHSPHVPLEDWQGHPCHDCSYVMGDDQSSYCEGCDHDFCESCISYCRYCDKSLCLGCLEDCPECDQRTCDSCMQACARCRKPCCRNCLQEQLCPTCDDQKQAKETSHDHSIPQPAGGDPGLQARVSQGTSHLSIRARRRRRHRVPQAA